MALSPNLLTPHSFRQGTLNNWYNHRLREANFTRLTAIHDRPAEDFLPAREAARPVLKQDAAEEVCRDRGDLAAAIWEDFHSGRI